MTQNLGSNFARHLCAGLFRPLGFLPATSRTPDIYYGDDRGSEKVAALTFLTLWFLDKPISELIIDRAAFFICGLSPISGAGKVEASFDCGIAAPDVIKKQKNYDYHFPGTRHAGSCQYPLWVNERMVQQGYISIYATSAEDDEYNGHTERWQRKLTEEFRGYAKPEEDREYQPIYTRPHNGLSIPMVAAAFELEEHKRDTYLSNLLREEFSDIDSLFDMVPKRVTHEVGHLLSHYTGLSPTADIEHEVLSASRNVLRKRIHRHYREAFEAVAELSGIALLKHVQKNANLDYGFPTTMLDDALPISYDIIEKRVNHLCQRGFPDCNP
jgi:hypothetical protein